MILHWMVLKNLERILNLAIKLDPYTHAELKNYLGKTIGVKVVGLPILISIGFSDEGICLLSSRPEKFDIYLEGPPLSLIKLSVNKREALNSGQIKLEGDMLFAESLEKCLQHLDIDFEEHLSKLFGDVIAHQASKTSKIVKDKLKKDVDTIRMNVSEYLQEESGLLVAPIAIENFINDVTDLSLATERLEARIARLTKT